MWDLAISEHGDLIFAAGRDLEFVEGTQLMNQRIVNRLRIKRGSWIFNRDSSLGSNLDSVIGHPMDQQLTNIPPLISDALAPIDNEITIQNVELTPELEGVTAILQYAFIVPDAPIDVAPQSTVQLLIPLPGVTTGATD